MQNSYLNLVSDVVEAVTEGRQPRSTGEDGAQAVDTVLACYASAARRQPVADAAGLGRPGLPRGRYGAGREVGRGLGARRDNVLLVLEE